MLEAIAQVDGVNHAVNPCLVTLVLAQRQGQHDVFIRRQSGDQIERLKDEPNLVATQLGEGFIAQFRQVGIPDVHRTLGQRIKPRNAMHECRLTRATRAHDCSEFAALEGNVDVVKSVHFAIARAVDLGGTFRVSGVCAGGGNCWRGE